MARHLPQPKERHRKLPVLKLPFAAEAAEAVGRGIQNRRSSENEFSLRAAVPTLAAAAIFALALSLRPEGLWRLAAFLVPCLITAAPVLLRILDAALRRQLRERDTLVILSALGAFCLGEYPAGALAVILYRFGELMEAFAVREKKLRVLALRRRLPDKASIETEHGVRHIAPREIAEGNVMVVMPGESIPADGDVLDGTSELDASLLTGEKGPHPVGPGDRVFSGCVSRTGTLRVRAVAQAEDSAAAKLQELVEIAGSNRAGSEKFVSRVTGAISLCIAVLGVFMALIPPLFNGRWIDFLYRGVSLLILASPCGLLISVPLAYFGGILRAAESGVTIKGTKFIEALAKTQTMVFEKTGTITENRCAITEVFPRGVSEKELLNTAAMAESGSRHPIAAALRAAADEPQPPEETMQVEERPCRGVSAFAGGKYIYVGNASLMAEHGIQCAVPQRKGTAVHVAADNEYLGYFLVNNKVREGAFDALEAMRHRGVRTMVMLTGDIHSVTRPLASSLNFDMVKTELTKESKLTAVEYLMASKPERASLSFVGDGMKDGALFSRADVGVVLGALGQDEALDQADILIMDEDIGVLADTFALAQKTDRIGRLNIAVALSLRAAGVLLALLGLLPMLWAVLITAAATFFALFNTLRLYIRVDIRRKRKKKGLREV